MRVFSFPTLTIYVMLWIGVQPLYGQVEMDDYHGIVSVKVLSQERRLFHRESLMDLKILGIKKILLKIETKDPYGKGTEKKDDTINIVESMRELEQDENPTKIVKTDPAGRPLIISSSGMCEKEECYDTVLYDNSGRVKAISGWSWDGSMFYQILYNPDGKIKAYDNDSHGGETAQLKYDSMGRIIEVMYDLDPTDVSDTKHKVVFEYGANNLVATKTVFGNLANVTNEEINYSKKWVLRKRTRYVYQ